MPGELENGKWKSGVEWDIDRRCKSTEEERRGRTHQCKFTDGHIDRHRCLCSRAWEHGEAKSA